MASALSDNDIMGKAIDKSLLKRLVVYLRPHMWKVILCVGLAILTAFLSALRPYVTKIAIDDHIVKKDIPGLMWVLAVLVLLILTAGLIQYGMTLMMQSIGQETIHRVRMQIFAHIQKLSMRFYDTTPVGRLVTRVTSDVEVLNEFFSSGLVMMAANAFTIIAIVVLMFGMSVKLSLITLVMLPLLLYATSIFRRKVRTVYRQVRTQLSRMNTFLNENITGIQTVKLFNQENTTFRQFDDINKAYTDAQVKSVLYYAVFFPVVDFLSTLAVALVIWYGGSAVVDKVAVPGLLDNFVQWLGLGGAAGPLTVGTLFAFFQYTEMFFRPVRELSDKYNVLQNTMASSERIFELMDTPAFAPDAPPGAAPFRVERGAIEFKNVDFSYDGEHRIVHDISFSVEPGQTVAIVGATGAGKTSIINILMRFYEFQNGSVRIDGRDIRDINVHDLRRDIALVMQDVFVFRGTLLDNITLDNPHVTPELATSSAATVGIAPFIEAQPQGYNTPVQERGATLSVGQKQLLSFARALAHDPKILILDEATSSVDTETEQMIQSAIETLLKGRTSIVIAHRLSTIRNADKILVMHNGKLRESGTHDQLLELGGIYSTLYHLQYKMQDEPHPTHTG